MPQTQVITPQPSVSTLPDSMHLASMAVCVAATSHSPADFIEWQHARMRFEQSARW